MFKVSLEVPRRKFATIRALNSETPRLRYKAGIGLGTKTLNCEIADVCLGFEALGLRLVGLHYHWIDLIMLMHPKTHPRLQAHHERPREGTCGTRKPTQQQQ